MQQAREAVGMSRRELAERVGIAQRYLANIELCGTYRVFRSYVILIGKIPG